MLVLNFSWFLIAALWYVMETVSVMVFDEFETHQILIGDGNWKYYGVEAPTAF